MAKGKQTCKILKEIRKQIAEENDIELVISECTYKGDCLGTCPKCEAEVRYLERELEKRQRLGKAAVFAGMSIGTLLSVAACDTTSKVTSDPDKKLAGDVVAIASDPEEPDTIITEPLMGLVMMYRNNFNFKSDYYQAHMKQKFAASPMKDMTVVAGELPYEHVSMNEKPCETLEELVDAVEEFTAPYYVEGEQKLMERLATRLDGDAKKYKGDLEVAFTVTSWGKLEEVEIVKGVNSVLDEEVREAFQQMSWEPAKYKLEGDSWPFDCRCVKKIQFPIEINSEPFLLEGEPLVPFEGSNVKIIKDSKN